MNNCSAVQKLTVVVKPNLVTKTYHLQNWLVACDSDWLGPAVVRKEGVTRELVVSAIAFNTGLKPGSPMLENFGLLFIFVLTTLLLWASPIYWGMAWAKSFLLKMPFTFALRTDPQKCKEAAAGEYRRRGKPTAHTQWDLETIHKFMSWQMSASQKLPHCLRKSLIFHFCLVCFRRYC